MLHAKIVTNQPLDSLTTSWYWKTNKLEDIRGSNQIKNMTALCTLQSVLNCWYIYHPHCSKLTLAYMLGVSSAWYIHIWPWICNTQLGSKGTALSIKRETQLQQADSNDLSSACYVNNSSKSRHLRTILQTGSSWIELQVYGSISFLFNMESY